MAPQPHDGRTVLTDKISGQLGIFVNSMEIAIRNNLPNRNVLAETTLKGLLNLIHGWNLVNANSIHQNYPGIDLIDTQRRIGVQVTSTNSIDKVRHTLEQVEQLPPEDQVDHLYILVITNRNPTDSMKNQTLGTCFSGAKDIWNIPELLRQIMDLDIGKLERIHAHLEAELGTLPQQKYLHLPLFSALDETSFVGREKELEEIREKLRSRAKPIVLSGLGGMGKTELAVRFGLNYQDGRVHFIRFDTSFTHTLAKMAGGIRPSLSPEELAQPEEVLYAGVMTLLEQCGETDVLIIDNVDADSGTLKNLMADPAYVRLHGMNLRLILTSRFHHDRSVIGVPALDYRELYRIFANHGANIPESQMNALFDAVKGHTLTIDLIARTLADEWNPVEPETMLDALENCHLAEADFAEVDADYQESTEQLHIYQRLRTVFRAAEVPPMEQDILRFATLLPESGMQVQYFRAALTVEQQKAFPALGRRGWLTAEDKLLTIHPVIRLVCREELRPGDENCGEFLEALWGQFDSRKHERVKFAQMAELFANAAELSENPEARAEWLNHSGCLWGELMQSKKAAALYKKHIPHLEQQIPGHPALATAYGNVGTTYGHLGDHSKALEFKLKDLAICEKVLPPDHPELATSYNNVGTTYGELGDYPKALEYLLKALAICEKVLSPNSLSLAASYNNVGTTYGHLGDHSKALEFQLKALVIREKVLPPDHPDLAIAYGNVGTTYGDLGDHNKALEYKLKALAILEKVLPPDHPQLATSYNNVGITYGELGDHNKALEYTLKALAICEKVLPPEHPGLATSYNNVGTTYGHLGDHSKALEFQLKALGIREKVLPPDHPQLAASYNNVGITYGDLGDHNKELEYQLKALAIQECVLPPGHADIATSFNNIAYTYGKLGDFANALLYERNALTIYTKALPAGHPNTENARRGVQQYQMLVNMQNSGFNFSNPLASKFPFK